MHTLQLKHFDHCDVNIFQFFLRKSEKSMIGRPNKNFDKKNNKKISKGDG